jgi:hypothetical protein
MATFKIFTWNMQRGQSISMNDNTIRLRYQILQALVNWADFAAILGVSRLLMTFYVGSSSEQCSRHYSPAKTENDDG